jgi:hypothetical protein
MRALVLIFCLAAAATALSAGREYEFKWDTGEWGTCVSRPTGTGAWFGNDFVLREYDGYD